MQSLYNISSERLPEATELLHLFKQADWAKNRSLDDTAKLLPEVDVFVTIRDGEKLIGFGRALSDGVFRAILDDIIVEKAFRGKGVGAVIVKNLMEQLSGIEEVLLHTEHYLANFYSKFGYTPFHGLTMNIKASNPVND